MIAKTEATIEDLYHLPDNGKAEIVDGELIPMPPTGDEAGYAGDEIFVSLRQYTRSTGTGRAVGDNKAFVVNLPNRKTFSPDAAFFTGEPAGMKFFQGAPILAVEVRSENDYGSVAERELSKKRTDYFAAGTLVVWDVDLLSSDVIKAYRASDPDRPTVYRRGGIAEAEPAVPDWRMPVDDLFPKR